MQPQEDRSALSDEALLHRYAADTDQAAFSLLVSRYVNFVYSTALRQVRDRHLAEDVTQAVFLILSSKSGRIRAGTILSNWLFCTTRYAAANALKTEARRRHHEHQSASMPQSRDTQNESDHWQEVAPLLDSALAALGRRDRDALLLKYIEGKTNRDVAAIIGITEEATRKRISRAVERLREFLRSRGVALSAAALCLLITTRAVEAAPPALAATASASVASGMIAGNGIGIAKGTAAAMAWANVKIAALWLAGVLLLGGVGATTIRHFTALTGAPTPAPIPAKVVLALAQPAPQLPAAPSDLEGVVRDFEGSPVVGAEVFVLTPKTPDLALYNPKTTLNFDSTDSTGHFSVPAPKQAWLLAIRDPAGFAQVTQAEFAKSNQIRLAPWGRIEGTFLIGSKPQAGRSILISRHPWDQDWEGLAVRHDSFATTDANGHFVFEAVAPGEIWLTHSGGKTAPPGQYVLHDRKHTLIEVLPGRTIKPTIGGAGQPVIGHLALTPIGDPTFNIHWVNDKNHYVDARFCRTDLPNMPITPDYATLTLAEKQQRYKQWQQTPQGRLRYEFGWNEPFDIQPDGSFRIDDVLPGKYQVALDYRVREGAAMGPPAITAFADFTIKEIPGGRTDQPLDVGLIQVKLRPQLRAGQPAPDFAVNTLDGKTIKLSDFRGKYVVIHFWFNWTQPEQAGPLLSKLNKTIADRKDFVLLNLTMDDLSEPAKRKLVEGLKIPGIHAYVKDFSKTMPEAYFSAPRQILIIDPQQNVKNASLQLEQADLEVAKIALEK